MSVDSIANEIPLDIEKRTQIFLYLEQNLSGDARKFPFLCFLSYRSVPFDSSNNKTSEITVPIFRRRFSRETIVSLSSSAGFAWTRFIQSVSSIVRR